MYGHCDSCKKESELEEYKGQHFCKMCVLDMRFKDRHGQQIVNKSLDYNQNNRARLNEKTLIITNPQNVYNKNSDIDTNTPNKKRFTLNFKIVFGALVISLMLGIIYHVNFFDLITSLPTIHKFSEKITLLNVLLLIFNIIAVISFFFIVILQTFNKIKKEFLHYYYCGAPIGWLKYGIVYFFEHTLWMLFKIVLIPFVFLYYFIQWFVLMIPLAIIVKCVEWPPLIAILLVAYLLYLVLESETFAETFFLYSIFSIIRNRNK